MKIESINVPASGIWEKGCEFMSLDRDCKGSRISCRTEKDDTSWIIHIHGIIEFKIISKNFLRKEYLLNLPIEGAFFEILDSSWIEEFENVLFRKIKKCKHYVLDFCDQTIEIIAQKLIFEKLAET